VNSLDLTLSLEYNDCIHLTFNPINPSLSTGLESVGEYLRDSATVNIIDTDS
jgi:hypothetical protein